LRDTDSYTSIVFLVFPVLSILFRTEQLCIIPPPCGPGDTAKNSVLTRKPPL
jgi:hypothetical protein